MKGVYMITKLNSNWSRDFALSFLIKNKLRDMRYLPLYP